jgi:hypothetical protein
MYCLRSLGSWDHGFESHSRHGCLMCVCVFLCLCCTVFRYRPCDELITRPRSPTVCEWSRKWEISPMLRKWEQAPKWEQRGRKNFIRQVLNLIWIISLIGAFVITRSKNASFFLHICPPGNRSHLTQQLSNDYTNFDTNLYWRVSQKFVEIFQFLLKSDNNNGTLHEDLHAFLLVTRA